MNKIVDWNIDDVIDTHQARKKRRIEAIAEVLRSKSRVSYKLFLAELQANGVRKSVAKGYIEVLRDTGKIRHEEEDLVWNEKSN